MRFDHFEMPLRIESTVCSRPLCRMQTRNIQPESLGQLFQSIVLFSFFQRPHSRRPPARPDFTTGHHKTVSPGNHGCCDMPNGNVTDGSPDISRNIVRQNRLRKARMLFRRLKVDQCTIVSTHNQEGPLSQCRCRCRSSHCSARHVGYSFPASARLIAVSVVQVFANGLSLPAWLQVSAAAQKESIRLHGRRSQHARRAGPGLKFLPASARIHQIERPECLHSPVRRRRLKTSCYVNCVTQDGTAEV